MKSNKRLFELNIEPALDKKENKCINASFFENGLLILSESPSYSLTEKIKIIASFTLMDEEVLDSLHFFLEAMEKEMSEAPRILKIENFSSSEYYLSFGADIFTGSLVLTDDEAMGLLSEKDLKIAKWNNKVVNFLKRWNGYLSAKNLCGKIFSNPLEAHLLRAQSRFLLEKSQAFLGPLYECDSLDKAIKNAAKIAFSSLKMPIGESRYLLENLFLKRLVPNLKNAKNKETFNHEYDSLVNEALTIDSRYSFGEIAYWIDNIYLELLLNKKFIDDERKVALLHEPILSETLVDFYGKNDAISYYKMQERNRLFEDENNSPIYNYLKSYLQNNFNFSPEKVPSHLA